MLKRPLSTIALLLAIAMPHAFAQIVTVTAAHLSAGGGADLSNATTGAPGTNGSTGVQETVIATGTNGSFAVPGSLTAGHINGAIVIGALDTLTDIGTQLNTAVARSSLACPTIEFAQAVYTFAVSMAIPRCATVEGNNAQLNWAGTSTTQPAVIKGSANIGDYTQGLMRNLKINCVHNTAIGLYLGGAAGSFTGMPSGNMDGLDTYDNISVQGCADGWVIGNNVYQDHFNADVSNLNTEGLLIASSFGSENMNFYGLQLVNNTDHGIYAANMLGAEYFFNNLSCDYNANGCSYASGGYLHFKGGHVEEHAGNKYAFNGPDVSGPSDLGSSTLSISGGMNFVVGAGAGITTQTALVRMPGRNSRLYIEKGSTLYTPGVTLSEFVDWEVAGFSSTSIIENYWSPTSNSGVPAIVAGRGIINGQQVEPPTWDIHPLGSQYAQTDEYHSAMTIRNATLGAGAATGFVGAINNLNGTMPSVPSVAGSPFPYNGLFLGWNAAGLGDADFFSPFNQVTLTNKNFDFEGVVNGAWKDLGYFDGNGNWTVAGNLIGNALLIPNKLAFIPITADPTGTCSPYGLYVNPNGAVGHVLYTCVGGAYHSIL